MKKLILISLLLCASQAWGACTVASIYVTYGGSYSLSTSTPTVVITGPGSGATASVNMAAIGSPATGLYVTSAPVSAGGSYTGPVSIMFTGGTYTSPATGYAIMSGSCGSGGGGGGRKKFAWLL
jgi:hypothetical protein